MRGPEESSELEGARDLRWDIVGVVGVEDGAGEAGQYDCDAEFAQLKQRVNESERVRWEKE